MQRREFLQLAVLSYGSIAVSAALANTEENIDVLFLQPSDERYDARRQLFNKRFDLKPTRIALCRTEKGVQQAVREANRLNLEMAIKGGGHSFEGFSLNQGGMVIDLSLMKAMSLNANAVLSCQPGVVLRELYDYVLPRQRILPAGSCGGVGVAGLALGGGYGLFSRQYGLTCDHLQRVRVVDSDGNIRDSVDHRELLWACRGAGNGHFGVVSHLEFATHSAPTTLFHARAKYELSSTEQTLWLAQQWCDAVATLPKEAFSAFVINGKTLTIVVTSTNDLNSEHYAPLFNALKQLAPKTLTIKSNPLDKAVKTFFGANGPLYFRNASGGFYRDFAELKSRLSQLIELARQTPGTLLQINTFGPVSPSTESAFPHRDYRFLVELQSYWDKPNDTARYMACIDAMQSVINQTALISHYGNYPDLKIPHWQEAYYGAENLQRLRKLKTEMDPSNRFRHAQSLLPLLR